MPPFPETPRVVYDRNPLEEVICQLRFPALLRIDAEIPAAFQESVRATFPLLREMQAVDVPAGVPSEFAELISRVTSPRSSYQFVTNDDRFVLALTRDFLALSTPDYRRWEEFRAHLEVGLNALVSVYSPDAFTRIGLRYRDVLCRSALGDTDRPWTDLLQPHVAGELADGAVGPSIEEAKRELLVNITGGKVRIRHGLAPNGSTGESCYVIDEDLFIEARTEVGDAVEVLQGFNRQAGHAFRWCISNQLHELLVPRPA